MTSADTEIAVGLPRLRDRSRDLTRNNPHARKALSVWVNNLVGCGIVPRAKSGNASLDKRTNELFSRWSDACDPEGQLDFYGIQDLIAREMIEGGEVLIRRRSRFTSDGLPVPLQLQVLEGEFLDMTRMGPTPGGRVVNGVEFNGIGRRTAYWLFQDHPGNGLYAITGSGTSQRIDAGDVAHLFRKERTQTRGIPWSAPVIRGLRDLDDYEVAEIMRKKTEACVVAVVTGADQGDEAIAPYVQQSGLDLAVRDGMGRPVERFSPGMIAYSHGAKQIEFNNPQGDGAFTQYKAASLRTIAAGYMVPYELLTGDLSQVNFSSARVGLVEFRRLCETVQWLCLIPMALQPVWRWFCESAYLAGQLPVPYVPVNWAPHQFDSVNPLDDANAELKAIRTGTLTLREAIARKGYDPDEVMAEHAATAAVLDDLGLVFDSDARKVSQGGNEQPSQAPQERTPE